MYNDNYGFSAVKESLQERLQHPFLMRYIDTPVIDEEKLFILYSILNHTNLHIEKKQQYALTIMLVQIALDTHEKVSDKGDVEAIDLHKRRQLTALAGDYYSGLYYYLLAQQSDICLIRKLAQGIKEINEQKIRLHQRLNFSVEDVVRSVEIVESALIQKTCSYFQIENLDEYSASFLARQRIKREFRLYKQQKNSIVFALWEAFLPTSEVESYYQSYLQRIEKQLTNLATTNDQVEILNKLLLTR